MSKNVQTGSDITRSPASPPPPLTTVSVAFPLSVAVAALAVQPRGHGDLHLQLFAFGGIRRHGVTVMGPQATLALRLHRLRRLVGRVRAGAPAALPSRVLRADWTDARVNQLRLVKSS